MSNCLSFILLCLAVAQSSAQPGANVDSLKRALAAADDDVTRLRCTGSLFSAYVYTRPDTAVHYAQQNMLLARRLHSDSATAAAYLLFKEFSFITGNYPQALHYAIEGVRLAEKAGKPLLTVSAGVELGEVYREQRDYKRALGVLNHAKAVFNAHFQIKQTPPASEPWLRYQLLYGNLGMVYERDNQFDSALQAMRVAEQAVMQRRGAMDWPPVYWVYGNVFNKQGYYEKAIAFYRQGVAVAVRRNLQRDYIDNCYGLASVYQKKHQLDSSIYYAGKVLEANHTARYPIGQLNALGLLAAVYKEKHNADSTAKYFEQALTAKDSLFNQEKLVQMQNLTFDDQVRRQEMQEAERKRTYRSRLYSLAGGLVVLGVVAFLLFRNNQHKQKAKAKIETAYQQLKAVQAQMIQQEKMASLGELTAGIAHEIQNPLNFVNNFSAVNKELVTELKRELTSGNYEEAKGIADDIEANEDKISHHGRRADSIVKGMLQHARGGAGEKQATDINKLIEECLRLSYHGFQEKDKALNVQILTYLSNTVGEAAVVPQDIAKVVVNLLNNAFYAVAEKKQQQRPNSPYEPVVLVISTRGREGITITVKDNGTGMPVKIADKVFQPFFTTKPTGEGTGLGLSLSYDIVTKGHGGTLSVKSKEGEESEFVVRLPV